MSIFPLKLDGVCVEFGQQQVLGPLTTELNGKGCSVIMGPNGSGKTTFLRLMHGLERPSDGRIKWALPKSETFKKQAFVFQTPIIMRRSVRDNVAYPLIVRGHNKADARLQAETQLAKVGLGGAADKDANVLSGGEKQKLAIVRALITDPEVLFLDEPTTNLDGASTRDIEKLILDVVARGTRVFIATHELGQARRLADDILFFYRGNIIEQVTKSSFFSAPTTKQAADFLKGDIVI